jgi:hypothetical protein
MQHHAIQRSAAFALKWYVIRKRAKRRNDGLDGPNSAGFGLRRV